MYNKNVDLPHADPKGFSIVLLPLQGRLSSNTTPFGASGLGQQAVPLELTKEI